MKDQYFGDVNDYLKYGLLRCCAQSDLRVGVCWMLTPSDSSSHGAKTAYLSDSSGWRSHDPALFDTLQAVVNGGNRWVGAVDASNIIPRALFFDEPVPDSKVARSDWIERSVRTLSGADLLFFDPDNGVEIPSKPKGRKNSSKYVFWDEIELGWRQGASLIIFQHFGRTEKRATHVARLAAELKVRAPGSAVTPLVTSHVLFLLASSPQHAGRTTAALELLKTRWGSKFRLVAG